MLFTTDLSGIMNVCIRGILDLRSGVSTDRPNGDGEQRGIGRVHGGATGARWFAGPEEDGGTAAAAAEERFRAG